MKILKIHIRNINSIKGDYIIDFEKEPFINAALFAIVGKTGAGKSTILDAIILALYGTVPRLGKLTKNKIEQFGSIITHGTYEALTEVEYSVGKSRYLSRWRISRNKNDRLRDYEMSLEQMTPDHKIIEAEHKTEVAKKNAQIIGLNEEHFLKSVVLAQGEFAKFLKSKPKDRLELLEQITGNTIFREISRAVFERKKKEELKYRELEQHFKLIELMTENERQKALDTINQLKQEIENINQQIIVIQATIKQKQTIENLQNDLLILKEEENRLIEQHTALKSKFFYLEQYDKLKDLLPQINDYKRIKADILKLNLEINNLDIQIKNENQKLKIFNTENKNKQQLLILYNQKLQEVQSYIKTILNLDKQIFSYKQVNAQQKQQIAKEKEKLIQLKTEQKKKQNELFNIERKFYEIKTFLEKNKIFDDLNQNIAVIQNIISSFIQKQEELKQEWKQSYLKEHYNVNANKLKQLIDTEFSVLNNEKKILLQKIDKKIDNPELELQKFYEYKEKITYAIKYSEEFSFNNKRIYDLEKQNKNIEKQIISLNDLITKIRNELEIQQQLLKAKQEELEYELLVSKYQEDRLKLRDNMPCPLCGSFEHPYVKSMRVSKKDTLRIELNKIESFVEDIRTKLQDTEIQKSSLQTTFGENLKQINLLKNKNKSIENNFKLLKLNIDINDINALKSKYKYIENEIHFLIGIKQSIEKLNTIEIKLRELEKLNTLLNGLFIIRVEVEKYWNKYNNYLKAQDLQEFISKLNFKNKKIQENKQILQNLDTKIKLLNESLYILDNQINNQIEVVNQQQKRLQYITQQLDAYLTKRENIKNAYLESKEPQEFLDYYSTKIEKIQNELTVNKQQIAKTTAIIEQKEQQKNQLINNLQKNKKNLSEVENYLTHKLQILGIEDNLSDLKIISPEQAAQIRNLKQELIKQRSKILGIIEEKNKQLHKIKQQIQITDNLEQLKNKLIELENKKQDANKKIGAITEQLNKDNQNRIKSNEIHKQLEQQKKILNDWTFVNSLIGSSDGRAFMQIALKYTMIELLKKANFYLDKLSKRYYLVPEQSVSREDLFVIDTYMGNTKRAVSTLSGGETFLVSLALSLALSDFASKQTSIKSMFIDEGFGTLDSDTLDHVLETLVKLQQITDKNIGIISHVESLRERIPVQIELVPIPGTGFSKIVVK